MTTENQFIDTILEDIAHNRLEFPVLPEVALRVRKLVHDPSATLPQVAKALGTDAALSSRIIQIANSAMFTGLKTVDNVKAAVNRLGLEMVRNVVTCVVMKTIYQPKIAPAIRTRMQDLWRHSTKVAAFSHALSKPFPNIKADEAMLSGLIHDIGCLPILIRAAKFPDIANDADQLQYVIDQLHTNVGKLILEAWHFPEEIITVAAEHEDLHRLTQGAVEYVDVVLVANLHSYLGTTHQLGATDWSTLPVFDRMNLSPEESIQALRDAKAEISAVYQLLGG